MTSQTPEENSLKSDKELEQETTKVSSPDGSLPERDPSETATPHQTGFIPATLEELKLVVWPSRQQLFSESIAVILMVTLSAASIAAVSRFYGWGASQVFR